jgi:hypothetical protein
MTLDAAELDRIAVASLAEEERPRGVVYVDDRALEPGDELEVDRGRVQVGAPTVVAFVDLEPGVNWGHRCRYVLVDRESGDVRAIDAQFPPFLRGASPSLRLVYRGPEAPDWAIATK